jgi:hypothetical protein
MSRKTAARRIDSLDALRRGADPASEIHRKTAEIGVPSSVSGIETWGKRSMLRKIFLKGALAFASSMAFAIDIPAYSSKNFSPMGDTPAYFINESIPVSARTADTTAGDSTAQEAAAPMLCVAAAVPLAHRNARRHAGYASVQRSSIHIPGKSRDTSHATRSAKANRGEATKTASLPNSATQGRNVSKKSVWSTNARGTTKSGTASSTKTTTAKHDKASARHAREAVTHPVAIIGIAVLAKARLLTAAEMERVTVGTVGAVAENQAEAQALAPGAGAAQTTASASTLAISSSSPVAGTPFAHLSSNYSNSQATASAIGGQLAETSGSSHISVAANGGAQIDAAGTAIAVGGERSQAQLSLQFYGLSIGHVDLAFGTAAAAACCAPLLAAQVTANGVAGGPYSQEVQAFPLSAIPGQVQSRADIAVASSSLPLVNAGQMMSLSPRASPFP